MRDYERRRRGWSHVLTVVGLSAVTALLAFASQAPAAAAAPAAPAAATTPASSGDPARLWSVSRIDRGTGAVPMGNGAQVGSKLQEVVEVGPMAFNLPLVAPYWYFLPRDRAFGSTFSSPDGAQYSVLAQAPCRIPPIRSADRCGHPPGRVPGVRRARR